MENLSKRNALIISIAFFLAAILIITVAMPREIKIVVDQPTAGESQETPDDDNGGNTPVVPDQPTDAPTAAPEQPTEAPTGDAQPTEAPTGDTKPTEAPAPGKGLNSTDPAKIAAFYTSARKATRDDGAVPKGKQSMSLQGKPTGGGSLGLILKAGSGIINTVLANNSVETTWIPGQDSKDILPTDIASGTAKVSADGKYTELTMNFKEQTDGADGDAANGGPVARGLSTLGSISGALDQLGAEIKEGRENVKLTYKNPVITCKVDNATNHVVSGKWSYVVHLGISSAKLKLVVTANATDVNADIAWNVVIPG